MTATIHRIYFSDSNAGTLVEAREDASRAFEASTIYDTSGQWQDTSEPGFILEVITHDNILPEIEALARGLKVRYKQESVLVTSQPIEARLI